MKKVVVFIIALLVWFIGFSIYVHLAPDVENPFADYMFYSAVTVWVVEIFNKLKKVKK